MGKLRGFINAHAKVSERKDAAKWIDQVQELTSVEFNSTEVAYLQYWIKHLKSKTTREPNEWSQIELLEKLLKVAEKLQQIYEETQEAKIFTQRIFCEGHGFQVVAPLNGYCPICRYDIYFKMTVEQAGSHYVTYCPHCKHSFETTKTKEA